MSYVPVCGELVAAIPRRKPLSKKYWTPSQLPRKQEAVVVFAALNERIPTHGQTALIGMASAWGSSVAIGNPSDDARRLSTQVKAVWSMEKTNSRTTPSDEVG